jgi:hypothetical protein
MPRSVRVSILYPYCGFAKVNFNLQNEHKTKSQSLIRQFPRRIITWFQQPPSRLSLLGTAVFVIIISTAVSDEIVQENNFELFGPVGGFAV